jgi:cytochrome c oxidase cbb3-type subunit 2
MYRNPTLFLIMAVVAFSVGSIVSTALPFFLESTVTPVASAKPYTPLQLEGRDIYIREGCNNCHTQTVRPLYSEVLRYGPYSRGGEFEYDRPFLWGSRRTGPDLARVGDRYPDSWHYRHMVDPQSIVPGSTMPPYPWLEKRPLDTSHTRRKLEVLGYPITDAGLAEVVDKTELDAMVAYLQCLGTAIERPEISAPANLANPYAGNPAILAEGEQLYMDNCAGCHGIEMKGEEGTGITMAMLIDQEPGMEADIVTIAWEGFEGAMPSFGPLLGEDRLWKIANYITSK